MKHVAPTDIRAHIHPALFPYGNIEDGTIEEVVAAEEWLKSRGCTHARGPLGPNTWHAYRAITESDDQAFFLGEPTFSPVVWEARGYQPCAHYASALAPNVDQIETAERRGHSLTSQGWTIRNMEAFESFASALDCFYDLSIASFANAFAYTPIDRDVFRELYAPVEAIFDPRIVLTAFSPTGEPGGFCFSIPDRLNPSLEQFIVKTLAVQPHFRQYGLGSWLTGEAHRCAHDLGWKNGGIHALMWSGSHSRDISKHSGSIFRKYVLYEKAL